MCFGFMATPSNIRAEANASGYKVLETNLD